MLELFFLHKVNRQKVSFLVLCPRRKKSTSSTTSLSTLVNQIVKRSILAIYFCGCCTANQHSQMGPSWAQLGPIWNAAWAYLYECITRFIYSSGWFHHNVLVYVDSRCMDVRPWITATLGGMKSEAVYKRVAAGEW